MFVDLLVTTYKRPKDIERLLPNLEQQLYPNFRLQIFDGSPDDLVKQAVESYLKARIDPKYPVIYHQTPSGMTRQRNIAVDHTEGDVSIFLDDDVELEPDYLQQVVNVFYEDARGEIGGLNGYDLNAGTELGKRQRIFRFLGLLPRIGCAKYLPWGHGTPLTEGGPFEGIRDCDVLIGHDMAWRTHVLKELRFAPFYEQYPTYVLYDDQDISLRARHRFRLVRCGTARLRHLVSPTARPPGYDYGFQTVFNAHHNWRIHCPQPSLSMTMRFWLWEGLKESRTFQPVARSTGWSGGLLSGNS
jgi:glycosyltransferase involved in cell wall biosynthesis